MHKEGETSTFQMRIQMNEEGSFLTSFTLVSEGSQLPPSNPWPSLHSNIIYCALSNALQGLEGELFAEGMAYNQLLTT